MRRSGRTTQQILEAPIGAVYVWVSNNTRYPRHLAYRLGRCDLEFVGPEWLSPAFYRGRKISEIVVDHATYLTPLQAKDLGAARMLTAPRGLSCVSDNQNNRAVLHVNGSTIEVDLSEFNIKYGTRETTPNGKWKVFEKTNEVTITLRGKTV